MSLNYFIVQRSAGMTEVYKRNTKELHTNMSELCSSLFKMVKMAFKIEEERREKSH
jgi:hypothetical protein